MPFFPCWMLSSHLRLGPGSANNICKDVIKCKIFGKSKSLLHIGQLSRFWQLCRVQGRSFDTKTETLLEVYVCPNILAINLFFHKLEICRYEGFNKRRIPNTIFFTYNLILAKGLKFNYAEELWVIPCSLEFKGVNFRNIKFEKNQAILPKPTRVCEVPGAIHAIVLDTSSSFDRILYPGSYHRLVSHEFCGQVLSLISSF